MMRRIFLYVAITVALVIFGGLLFALWMASSDGPRPDTSDLEPVRAVVPDDQNGYVVLRSIFPQVKWDDDLRAGRWDTYQKLGRAKVESLLVQNEKPLAALDTALGMPAFQVEPVPSLGRINDHKPLQNLGRVKLLSAFNHWEKNERHMAFEDALQLAQYARKIQNGDGTLIHFLVGISVEAMDISGLTHFVSEAQKAEHEDLLKVMTGLKPLTDHSASYAKALQVEFKEYSDLVDDISTGKRKLEGFSQVMGNPNAHVPMLRITFQHNETLGLFATTFRTLIHDAPFTYDKATLEPEPLATFSKQSRWQILVSPNGTGKALYMVATAYSPTISTKCRIETAYGMMRALIAVRLYWLDHGVLPAKLDDLVPGYIEAVPLDAYDGKPLRYSPARKVIYSVGTDLTDNGGDLSDNNKDGDHQPTIKIEW